MRVRLLVPAALLTLLASSVGAQVASPVSFTVFGGAAFPTGDSGDFMKTGYTLGAAMDVRFTPTTPIAGRLEGGYSRFGVKGLEGSGISADASDVGLNANLVLLVPNRGVVRPYITAGPSYSRLKVAASAFGESDSESDSFWGFNVGGGLDFALGALGARIDLRYKSIDTDGDNFTTVPLTFGIRF